MELLVRNNRGQASSDGRETHYVGVSFHAPKVENKRERLPLNLALVLDRSGSMGGQKLVLAMQAISTGLDLLRESDRFALVVFDEKVDVIKLSGQATDAARREALTGLNLVSARGSTDLAGGWTTGAAELKSHREGHLSRVIVATDGLANHGMVNPADFAQVARDLQKDGIVTSTIGIGTGFQEELLRGMADHGRGNAYYAEDPKQLLDILAGELGEALEVTMRNVVIEIRMPRGMSVTLVDRLPVTPRGEGGFDVTLGDLTSGQRVDLVFEVVLPAGRIGETLALPVALREGAEQGLIATGEARWTYATPAEAAAAPRESGFEAQSARRLIARSEEAALNLNRAGRFDEAHRIYEELRVKLGALDPANEAVRAFEEDFQSEVEQFSMPMGTVDMKRRYAGSAGLTRGRTLSGTARKDP